MSIDLQLDQRALRETDHPLPDSAGIGFGTTKETTRMLLHEELARERIRDLHTAVAGSRAARQARAARRWARVARWASQRSRRYHQ
ncbi:hypothetical protein [Prauserella muralis]|uniref:Uncharacterized protein n=1 Tax=Prauserella muralis TaxID=588067 RepID=A0A2V4BB01_9PSEU|nr:hypothetical protein [Prauserella muralis]PXY32554.1 hypothetical protein BAY60_09930 [Prauserella muralis]TWE23735.1 hypothetical protein FHX69_5032 [Prauserella muralis]